MARIAIYADTNIDLVTRWNGMRNPWQDLVAENGPIDHVMEQLGFARTSDFDEQVSYQSATRQQVLLLRHPLWQENHPMIIDARAKSEEIYPDFGFQTATPFRIVRRPIDVLLT